MWEEELVPLRLRSQALTPVTLLEHLQCRKPDVDWIPLQWTLPRRVREWKALHGPDPEVIFALGGQKLQQLLAALPDEAEACRQ